MHFLAGTAKMLRKLFGRTADLPLPLPLLFPGHCSQSTVHCWPTKRFGLNAISRPPTLDFCKGLTRERNQMGFLNYYTLQKLFSCILKLFNSEIIKMSSPRTIHLNQFRKVRIFYCG